MTYNQAKKLAKANKGFTYEGNAGNNCKFQVYWCAFRNRVVSNTITASGLVIS